MTNLYKDLQSKQWPIIYSSEYNISFWGLEKLHPFDAGKWGRVYQFLKDNGMISDDTTVRSTEASQDDLMVVHAKSYLNSLRWSITVAGITEVPPVALLPNPIVQRKALKPFRYQTGGTIMAGKFALERGWAINIGGGFHHCSAEKGGGFCAYADITLAIKFLFDKVPDRVQKAMIIDLDAHQGNGHERDFMGDDRVYILDVYNRNIYPHDGYAKRGIRRKVELNHFTEDDYYLKIVNTNIEGALNEFKPDVIVYNAGTDVLDGDPLGCLSISAEGIIKRDELVFHKARTRDIPIMMVTSGGYQRSTARIIADSILNLRKLGYVSCEAAEEAQAVQEAAQQQASQYQQSGPLPRNTSESGMFSRFRRWMNGSNNNSSDARETRPTESQSCATSPTSETAPVMRETQSCASTPSSEQPPIVPPFLLNKDNLNDTNVTHDKQPEKT